MGHQRHVIIDARRHRQEDLSQIRQRFGVPPRGCHEHRGPKLHYRGHLTTHTTKASNKDSQHPRASTITAVLNSRPRSVFALQDWCLFGRANKQANKQAARKKDRHSQTNPPMPHRQRGGIKLLRVSMRLELKVQSDHQPDSHWLDASGLPGLATLALLPWPPPAAG